VAGQFAEEHPAEGPAVGHGAVEALDLAVGPRPIGPGPLGLDAHLAVAARRATTAVVLDQYLTRVEPRSSSGRTTGSTPYVSPLRASDRPGPVLGSSCVGVVSPSHRPPVVRQRPAPDAEPFIGRQGVGQTGALGGAPVAGGDRSLRRGAKGPADRPPRLGVIGPARHGVDLVEDLRQRQPLIPGGGRNQLRTRAG
jgi:hypothetical protein